MNDSQITPDDPRLTAYALDELDPAERAVIEAALLRQPALRATVDSIRATTDAIEAALKVEETAQTGGAAPETAASAPAIAPRRDQYASVNGRRPGQRMQSLLRFPQLYYVVGGLAAAGFAVVVALREPPAPPMPVKKVYQLVELRPSDSARAADSDAGRVELPAVTPQQEASPASQLSLLDQVKREVAPPPALPPPPQTLARGNAPAAPPATTMVRAESSSAGDVVMLQPFVVSTTRDTGALAAVTAQSRRGPTFDANVAFGGTLQLGVDARSSRSREFGGPEPAVAHNTEAYSFIRDNDFVSAARNPLSTFAIDVDTASYANVRRYVQLGRLPPADAVRIEELINYFPYRYRPPASAPGAAETPPFAASLEVAAAPWAPANRLLRIGIKGREVAPEARPAANLVFLVDVSGSMDQPNKLPLVKESMQLLLGRLRSDDRVAIVTYAGQSGLALPSTPVGRSREITDALQSLRPGGSTNGAMGITLAYEIAKANFTSDGVNRVILCTDGDFNVGVTSQGDLVRLIEERAKSGVFLTVLGFGMGNLKDATLETLADKGNGAYGYIDTRREAEKLLVEEMSGTLVTIAKDVKIQVDFNPAKVASYRLIGYENRSLKPEDFANDKVDAGEIGAGHTVTALYEIVPVGATEQPAISEVEDSKYQPRAERPKLPDALERELLTLRVRYKEPGSDVSRKLEFPLTDSGAGFDQASADFKFSSAVAAFGMILRDSPNKGRATIGSVIEWGTAGSTGPADDPLGYRREFLDLARQVQAIIARG